MIAGPLVFGTEEYFHGKIIIIHGDSGDRKGSDNYILELEQYVERLLTENNYLKEKNTSLSSENESMKRKLLLYENPHTPPSLKLFKPKNANPPGKRGAPLGHRGATRIHDKPDEIIHVSEERCPECQVVGFMDYIFRHGVLDFTFLSACLTSALRNLQVHSRK